MSILLASALNATAQNRLQRIQAIARQQQARENATEIVLTYAGYRDGRHWARRLDGGELPVTPASNGSIQQGDLLMGVIQPDGSVLASWMPR